MADRTQSTEDWHDRIVRLECGFAGHQAQLCCLSHRGLWLRRFLRFLAWPLVAVWRLLRLAGRATRQYVWNDPY